MPTVTLKGPGVNNWFAKRLVDDLGPNGARERTCGPMLAAVEAVIAEREPSAAQLDGGQGEGEKA